MKFYGLKSPDGVEPFLGPYWVAAKGDEVYFVYFLDLLVKKSESNAEWHGVDRFVKRGSWVEIQPSWEVLKLVVEKIK